MLYEMLAASADRFPQRTAIETQESAVGYADLLHAVDGFGVQLRDAGISKGDRVMLLLPNSVEFAVATFAVAKLHGIVVLVNTSSKSNELSFYLRDSGARKVITTPQLRAEHGELIREIGATCMLIDNDGLKCASLTDQSDRSIFEGDAVYQYSSGSSAMPKRVVHTHAELDAETFGFTRTLKLTADDSILTAVPMSHSYGFGSCMLAAIRVAARLVVMTSFNRRQVLRALAEKRISMFAGVPLIYNVLANSPSIPDTRFPEMRFAFTGGAPLEKTTYDRFLNKFGVPIRSLYGTTETGCVTASLGSIEGDLWASVGKTVLNAHVKIVDEAGKEVPAGQDGEVFIRSPGMAAGYRTLTEETERSFVDGYFRPGDLGRLDADGNLFVTGRTTLYINVGGNKVDPAEVEAVINSHPAVSECVVLGVASDSSNEVVKAAVVSNGDCRAGDIREWCRGRIADFKVPRIVEFRDEIPRNPMGKILRKYLQAESERQ